MAQKGKQNQPKSKFVGGTRNARVPSSTRYTLQLAQSEPVSFRGQPYVLYENCGFFYKVLFEIPISNAVKTQ